MVLQGVKSRVFDWLRPYAGKWARELPSVLWALRTSSSRATGESPFFLTYGSDAVLPTELEFGSPRTSYIVSILECIFCILHTSITIIFPLHPVVSLSLSSLGT